MLIHFFCILFKRLYKKITNWDGNENTKPRKLLQDIEVFSYFYDIIIVSDARLIDEITSIKEKYPVSISIWIDRTNYNNLLNKEEKSHITEIGLDYYNNFDYRLINNNFYNLKEDVENILRRV